MEKGLTIKSEGMCVFEDTEKLKIKFNGENIPCLRSMKIEYDIEEVPRVVLEVLDFNLDLENVPYEIKVDELKARILLKKIFHDSKCMFPAPVMREIEEMINGMLDVVDMTTRDSNGFRQRIRTDSSNDDSSK